MPPYKTRHSAGLFAHIEAAFDRISQHRKRDIASLKASNMLGLLKIAWPAAALLLSASHVEAKTRDGRLHPNLPPRPLLPIEDVPQLKGFAATPVTSRNGTVLPPYDTTYYFDQLIDHNNPSLGTFKQRYWHTYEWYERGGSTSTRGESGSSRATN